MSEETTPKKKNPGHARTSKVATVKVKVITKTHGTYKKGDVIEMHKSTADACIKNGVVEMAK